MIMVSNANKAGAHYSVGVCRSAEINFFIRLIKCLFYGKIKERSSERSRWYVPNVTFDFSYFDAHQEMIEYYPKEFATKYAIYQKQRTMRWIELDSPTSFAIKCNSDILHYSIPPFAGILREIYDIEDYKQLKKTKTALENYAMLAMTLPMDSDGSWLIDYDKAKDFWFNLDSVLPEEVGSVLTPMKIDKIDFEKSNTGDTDRISEAEQNLFTAAGVSSLLFNNEKASSNSLLLSIKADQSITYGIVKSIEDALNRFIQSQGYGKNFKINFLDVSPFNRKEVGDAYLKAATYGIPCLSLRCLSVRATLQKSEQPEITISTKQC